MSVVFADGREMKIFSKVFRDFGKKYGGRVWLFKCSKTKLKKIYIFLRKKIMHDFYKIFFFSKKLFV